MFLYGYIYILLLPPFSMDNKKETISLKVNSDLWKKVRLHCVEKDLQYSQYVESLVKKDLGIK